MVATQVDIKEQIVDMLDDLSIGALKHILNFVEYQQYRQDHSVSEQTPRLTPYEPVKLGGIAPELDVSEEAIKRLRREMWRGDRK